MTSYERRATGELLRAWRSEESLIEQGDVWALYQKRYLEAWGKSPISQGIGFLARLGVVALGSITPGPRVWVDPILVRTTFFGKREKPILHARDGRVWPISGRYLEIFYYGGLHTLPNLSQDLAKVAQKLSTYSKLPPQIIGITHHDMTFAATKALDVPVYAVAECKQSRIYDALDAANVVRELRQHRPLPDPRVYALCMSTDQFIARFSSVESAQPV